MAMSQCIMWGVFPGEIHGIILDAVESEWKKAGSWGDVQKCITHGLIQRLGTATVHENVPMSALGIPGSATQIDIVLGNSTGDPPDGVLIHVSGHTSPRHEKELLEILAISAGHQRFKYGVLIVCSDNKLRLEGRAASYAYCSGPLLRLAEPVLRHCNFLGLLIVGLPTPFRSED